jgi:hypothetical protein
MSLRERAEGVVGGSELSQGYCHDAALRIQFEAEGAGKTELRLEVCGRWVLRMVRLPRATLTTPNLHGRLTRSTPGVSPATRGDDDATAMYGSWMPIMLM